MIDSWADACADWPEASSHSSFPQRHYSGYSGCKWLQPQKAAAPVRPLAQAASLWYEWRQVIHLYVVSIELSAQKCHHRCTELHWTALQPSSAGSGFTSPTTLKQQKMDGRMEDGGMDIEYLSPEVSRLQLWVSINQDNLNWLSGNLADDKNGTNTQ